MSNNAITLLKVLLHGDIYIDEIEKYTNLDNATVDRNIQVLNEYLKDKGINPIKKQIIFIVLKWLMKLILLYFLSWIYFPLKKDRISIA